MNILFWNLAKHDNRQIVKSAILNYSVDIAVFAEYSSTNMEDLCNNLSSEYYICDGYGGCDKVIMIVKKGIIASVSREDTRYTLYFVEHNSVSYIIAGIHLPASPGADKETRKIVIRRLVHEIHELELEMKCNNTIVIGDYNASPFDEELIQKDCFNAVLFQDLIMKSESVKVAGSAFRRFYNPIITYINENPKMYGSFYHSNGANSLYWYCLDQVIMRKSLIDSFIRLEYLRKIGNRSLMNNTGINDSISDHLPLLVVFG